jgi:RNA polymerase sigma-70 factor (ECF subfamily)
MTEVIAPESLSPATGSDSGAMTDSEAVSLARQGDPAGFEHLYRKNSRRVYALCLRMTGNPGEAEDLTQEAFLQVFRKIQTFRGESAFSTWLHRLAVNIVLMRKRRKALHELPLEGDAQEESEERPREIDVRDLALAGAIDRLHLARALAQLAPGYRQTFVLHDVHGYEHNEIARLLGTSIGNSKSQLHKACARLRKLLQGIGREGQHEKRISSRPRSARGKTGGRRSPVLDVGFGGCVAVPVK